VGKRKERKTFRGVGFAEKRGEAALFIAAPEEEREKLEAHQLGLVGLPCLYYEGGGKKKGKRGDGLNGGRFRGERLRGGLPGNLHSLENKEKKKKKRREKR